MMSADGQDGNNDVSIVETCRMKIAMALDTQDVKVIGTSINNIIANYTIALSIISPHALTHQ